MDKFIGEFAALTTSVAWSFTSMFFTIAGKEVGSMIVNRTRLLFASSYLVITHFILYGSLLPIHAESYRWEWLALSGFIGLVIGDGFLFQAFVLIGARISMLLMSLVPIISTILAWLFLKEILTIYEIIAIIMTVGGIVWVILERNSRKNNSDSKNHFWGILFALGGALGQAFALITAKKGLGGDFPALSANLIRVVTATVFFWVIAVFQGKTISNFRFWRNKKARWSIIGGSVFGPFFGIWLSMIAIKYANIGIASTLMALPPIFLLPLTYWIFKERHSWRTIVGTVLAVAGVAIIFLV
jgi:drug/metabolite transporter (DMT)-like permease